MGERFKINEYYENPQQFVEEIKSINIRKLVSFSDKELIKKLKRWYKTYGIEMNLYESQYARLKQILNEMVE